MNEQANSQKGLCTLAYIGPLVLIPLIMNEGNKEVKYNANQGLVLFLVELVYEVIARIISSVFHLVLPLLGSMVSTLFTIGTLYFIYLSIKGIINVAQGKYESPLPIIGGIQILK